jgi:hypothetical protein
MKVASASDTGLLWQGRAYLNEIKTPAGDLSDPRQSVMAAVRASGGRGGVVRNADEMLGCSMHGAYRGRRSNLHLLKRVQW